MAMPIGKANARETVTANRFGKVPAGAGHCGWVNNRGYYKTSVWHFTRRKTGLSTGRGLGTRHDTSYALHLCHLLRRHRRRDHLQAAARDVGHLLDRAAPQVLDPAPAGGHRFDQAGHAVDLIKDAVTPERIVPPGDGPDEVERVVEAGVADENVDLLPPRLGVGRRDQMVAIELVVLHLLAVGIVDDHAGLERFFVALAADRRREDGHLHADRA